MPVMDLYYPFDTGAGAAASQARWFNLGGQFRDSGVLRNVGNYLRPSLPQPTTLNVATGGALIKGVYCENQTAVNLTVPSAIGTGGIVVAQADFINKVCNIVYNDTAHSVVQTASLWEIMIAQLYAGVMYDCRTMMAPVEPLGHQSFLG